MKLHCISMVRDEASILPAFADQISAFFDEWTVLDHASADSGIADLKSRNDPRIEILHLAASGYPQSEVVTFLAKRAFSEKNADVVVPLDCDEFLPFANRNEFEAFLMLHKNQGAEVILMNWLNLAPEKFDGGNIFKSRFDFTGLSRFTKVIVFRELFERCPDTRIAQGNHLVNCGSDAPARVFNTSDTPPLLHIPIRSFAQFALKLSNGSRVVLADPNLLKRGLGLHWVTLAVTCATQGFSSTSLRRLAMGYPDMLSEEGLAKARILSFTCPYVRSARTETSIDLAAAILRPIGDQLASERLKAMKQPYAILDQEGHSIL
jgi:hypothetical protein